MFMLVTYDVKAHRTQYFHKILSQYLTWFQNSVFTGDISESQLKRLHFKLAKIMEPSDRVIQICAENRHNVDVHILSKNAQNGALEFAADTSHSMNSKVI